MTFSNGHEKGEQWKPFHCPVHGKKVIAYLELSYNMSENKMVVTKNLLKCDFGRYKLIFLRKTGGMVSIITLFSLLCNVR